MNITFSTILFFTIALLVLGAGHWFLWTRLVRRTGMAGRTRRIVTWWIVGMFALILPMWIGSRILPREVLLVPTAAVFSWKGLLFYIVLVLAAWEAFQGVLSLGRRVRPARKSEAPPDPERRVFLRRVAAATSVAGGAAVGALGVRSAIGDIETPEVPVKLERLPTALSGYRLAVISDVHLGPVTGETFMAGVVERTNALRPDAVLVCGDLVDGSVERLRRDVAPLLGLRSRDGTYFVTGNHEYYSGVAAWMDHLDDLGVRVLRNERVTLGDQAPGGASFDLAGVHDYRAASVDPRHAPDLAAAVRGRDPERELVLLAHQPKHVDEAVEHGVGLQVSGHTHGGQIWPFGYITALVQPYLAGLHRHAADTQIYVTCGTGFWGPPMRVLAPPEITLLVLHA